MTGTKISQKAVLLAAEISQIDLKIGDSLLPWQRIIQQELDEEWNAAIESAAKQSEDDAFDCEGLCAKNIRLLKRVS